MTNLPDQERVWNAYGHAMGAALGVELVIRIANFHTRAAALLADPGSPGNFKSRSEKLQRNVFEGTFGQIAAQFMNLHPKLVEPLFQDVMSDAVKFRNRLGHQFLGHHVHNLRSERGLDTISAECMLYMDHFQRLEDHIRAHSDINWAIWDRVTTPKPDDPRHPLDDWFPQEEE